MDAPRAYLVGDVCIDLLLPFPEERGNAYEQREPLMFGGGTVANTAVALARLERETHFVGVVGDDGFGRIATRQLAAEGIDVARVAVSRAKPTMLVIGLIDAAGQRTVYAWPLRDSAFSDLHPDQVADLPLRRGDWLHVSGTCMAQATGRQATLAALERARAVGVPSSFDLSLRLGLENRSLAPEFLEVVWRAMRLATFVLGSVEEELIHLIPDETDPRQAARALAAQGGCTAVMRQGASGVHVSRQGEQVLTVPAFAVPVVDTIGAGDAFNAGFIHAGLAGMPLERQVRWGHAVAGLQIGASGARSAPSLAQARRFLSRQRPARLP